MNSWDKLKLLRLSLSGNVRLLVQLEYEINKYKFSKSFYSLRLDLIRDNLDTLKDGNYIISLMEYKLILRDYYYNRANYCEVLIYLNEVEERYSKVKVQVEQVEKEMDDLIKEIENSNRVLPFRRKINEQE